jgi:hypothetical protein
VDGGGPGGVLLSATPTPEERWRRSSIPIVNGQPMDDVIRHTPFIAEIESAERSAREEEAKACAELALSWCDTERGPKRPTSIAGEIARQIRARHAKKPEPGPLEEMSDRAAEGMGLRGRTQEEWAEFHRHAKRPKPLVEEKPGYIRPFSFDGWTRSEIEARIREIAERACRDHEATFRMIVREEIQADKDRAEQAIIDAHTIKLREPKFR